MSLKASDIIKIHNNPSMVTANIEEDMVMMDMDSGSYYGLNEIGSKIWGYLHKPCQICEVTKLLYEEYDIDEQSCENYVLNFSEQLLSEGLIEICS